LNCITRFPQIPPDLFQWDDCTSVTCTLRPYACGVRLFARDVRTYSCCKPLHSYCKLVSTYTWTASRASLRFPQIPPRFQMVNFSRFSQGFSHFRETRSSNNNFSSHSSEFHMASKNGTTTRRVGRTCTLQLYYQIPPDSSQIPNGQLFLFQSRVFTLSRDEKGQ
jgi:hypothetical protein